MDNQKPPPSETDIAGTSEQSDPKKERKESTSSDKQTFNTAGNVGEPPQEQAKHAKEMVDDEE